MKSESVRLKYDILPDYFNNNWMIAVNGWSRYVTGSATITLIQGRIPYLVRKVVYVYITCLRAPEKVTMDQ